MIITRFFYVSLFFVYFIFHAGGSWGAYYGTRRGIAAVTETCERCTYNNWWKQFVYVYICMYVGSYKSKRTPKHDWLDVQDSHDSFLWLYLLVFSIEMPFCCKYAARQRHALIYTTCLHGLSSSCAANKHTHIQKIHITQNDTPVIPTSQITHGPNRASWFSRCFYARPRLSCDFCGRCVGGGGAFCLVLSRMDCSRSES